MKLVLSNDRVVVVDVTTREQLMAELGRSNGWIFAVDDITKNPVLVNSGNIVFGWVD